MRHRLLARLRALAAFLADPDGALRRADDYLAADERLLARIREQDAARVRTARHQHIYSQCPILACPSCVPAIPAWVRAETTPADYSRHHWPAADTAEGVVHWMISAWPDAWYYDPCVSEVAARLIAVRSLAAKGKVTS